MNSCVARQRMSQCDFKQLVKNESLKIDDQVNQNKLDLYHINFNIKLVKLFN